MARNTVFLFLVALCGTLATGEPLMVDLSDSGDVQEGWVDWNAGGRQNNIQISNNFETDFGDLFILFDSVDTRNRAQVDPSIPLHDLLDDVFKESGPITMRIRGLSPGQYVMTTYHHDPLEDVENDDGTINITVTDAIGQHLVAEQFQQSWGPVPEFVAAATFEFRAGAGEVVIVIQDNDDGIHNEAHLNGFILDRGTDPRAALAIYPPVNGTDIVRDVTLSWEAGEEAVKHDVYIGMHFEDVNNASTTDERGVLVSSGQTATTFDAGRLEFNTTYYWRIDEVNAPSSPGTFKGEVWSFTTEPATYPVVPVAATASSVHLPTMGPENTINGSGLSADGSHSNEATHMWLTSGADTERWIQYEFAKPQQIDEMWVWNSNQAIESFVGFGAKTVSIDTSMDGATWTPLADVPEFAQASGSPTYVHNTVVDFGGVEAKYVKLTIIDGWSAIPQRGLSEVRFYAVPVYARHPQPEVGTLDLPTEVELSWRAGREAGSHDVYVGADPDALELVGQTPDNNYTVSVDLNTTHYWRIDEVNNVEDPAVWEGDVWNFTTALYTSIDDMESYRDAEFLEIWATWEDGYEDSSNGSLVGNGASGAPEEDIIYDGRQSLPLTYGQSGINISEATRTFASPMDWSKNGVKTLSLMFYGGVTNTSGQLYIGINGTRISDYPGAMADITQPQWHAWKIDLGALGITTVNSMTIGIQGGSGKIFVDAIRLYPTVSGAITPVMPDDTGLVGHYSLNNNTQDLSGNGHNGTSVGNPLVVEGPAGTSGLRFDGTGTQYIDLGTWNPSEGTGQLTVSLWTQWAGLSTFYQGMIGKRNSWSETNMMWDLEAHQNSGLVRFGRNGSTVASGLVPTEQGEWEPWGVTFDGSTAVIYRHGLAVASGAFSFGTKTDANMQIGACQVDGGNPYNGSLAEVRLYNRALSPAEVAGLGGRTAPFFQP